MRYSEHKIHRKEMHLIKVIFWWIPVLVVKSGLICWGRELGQHMKLINKKAACKSNEALESPAHILLSIFSSSEVWIHSVTEFSRRMSEGFIFDRETTESITPFRQIRSLWKITYMSVLVYTSYTVVVFYRSLLVINIVAACFTSTHFNVLMGADFWNCVYCSPPKVLFNSRKPSDFSLGRLGCDVVAAVTSECGSLHSPSDCLFANPAECFYCKAAERSPASISRYLKTRSASQAYFSFLIFGRLQPCLNWDLKRQHLTTRWWKRHSFLPKVSIKP